MENYLKNESSISDNEKFDNYTDEDNEIKIARENLEKIKNLNE